MRGSTSLLAIFAKHGASLVARKICEEVAPILSTRHIPRGDGGPYLHRYYFTREVQGEPQADVGMFLHKFVGDDDVGIVHNHPWTWCMSVILAGSYSETRYKWSTKALDMSTTEGPPRIAAVNLFQKSTRLLLPFDVNFIDHEDMHRVSLIGRKCWTLFIHGPRVSTWGLAEEDGGKFTEIRERTRVEERLP